MGIALLSFAVHAHRGAYEAFALACAAAALVVATAGRMASLERPRLRAFTLDLVLATATIVALLAIAESMGLPLPWSDETRRPQSTLGNRNFVGAYAAIALPLLALAKGMHRARSWRSAALVVIVATLVVTRCRSAWLAGLLGGAVVLAAGAWRARRAGGPGASGLLAVLALSGLGVVAGAAGPWRALRWTEPAPLSSTLRRLGEYNRGSGKTRINQRRIALAMVRSSPLLGVGPHGWADSASANARVVPGEHTDRWLGDPVPSSDMLGLATETGVAGLLAGLLVLGLFAKGAWRHARAHPRDAADAVAIGAALLCVAVHGVFDSPCTGRERFRTDRRARGAHAPRRPRPRPDGVARRKGGRRAGRHGVARARGGVRRLHGHSRARLDRRDDVGAALVPPPQIVRSASCRVSVQAGRCPDALATLELAMR